MVNSNFQSKVQSPKSDVRMVIYHFLPRLQNG
jgi:hypothetical protein